jgi:hypothetical protein
MMDGIGGKAKDAAVYSDRSAVIGSSAIARRAGSHIATRATITTSDGAARSATGSRGPTP